MEKLRDKDGLTEEEFLARYDASRFERPSVTVDVAAFKWQGGDLYLLLIKRGGHPFLGKRALPGGFVEPDETVETAAARELEEETSVKGAALLPIGVFSEPLRDPRTRIITVAYLALLEEKDLRIEAGDDAASADWVRVCITERRTEKTDGKEVKSFKVRLVLSELGKGEEDIFFKAEFCRELSAVTAGTVCSAEPLNVLAGDHAKIVATAADKLMDLLEKNK